MPIGDGWDNEGVCHCLGAFPRGWRGTRFRNGVDVSADELLGSWFTHFQRDE